MSISIILGKSMSKKDVGGVEKKEGGDTIESRSTSSDRVPPDSTPEERKIILSGRVAALNAELRPILQRHGFAFSAEPFIKDGKILAKPIIVDTTDKEVDDTV